MSAVHDAVVALTDQRSSGDARQLIDELTERQKLSLESVTFLRGRSLQQQMVVIDEAQNLEPTTLRTIPTRVGEGTKWCSPVTPARSTPPTSGKPTMLSLSSQMPSPDSHVLAISPCNHASAQVSLRSPPNSCRQQIEKNFSILE